MQWKQFLTPVESIDGKKAHALITSMAKDKFVLLDVRQPKEYQEAHLPGSKLIPLPELTGRLSELDPQKTTIVY